jgi:hypothetical protein
MEPEAALKQARAEMEYIDRQMGQLEEIERAARDSFAEGQANMAKQLDALSLWAIVVARVKRWWAS